MSMQAPRSRRRSRPARSWRGAAALWLAVAPTACVSGVAVPAPEPAVAAFAAAVEQGDADAIYAMMSEESRRALSRDELRRVLREQKGELTEHARVLSSGASVVNARADLRYGDGEVVSLDLVDGAFRVRAADALPGAARTAPQALGQLRRVLARRSYAGLVRVLSPRARAAMERDLRSLVEGLEEPESLRIDEAGDTATVDLPDGHRVKLRREEGVWYVDDFN